MKDVLIPTEAIGSIPRPLYLYEAIVGLQDGRVSPSQLADVIERAVAETIKALEAPGSRIITDGEQAKSSFVTYPLDGAPNLEPNGFVIPFEDGHTRQLPILTEGPFRYQRYAGEFAARTRRMTKRKVKQAVISPTALSLIYPDDGVEGYSRDTFYRYRQAVEEGGLEARVEKSRRKPNLRSRTAPEIEQAVLSLAIEQPALGQVRVSNELRKQGYHLSPAGVRGVVSGQRRA